MAKTKTTAPRRGRPPGNKRLDRMGTDALLVLAREHEGNVAAMARALRMPRQGLDQHLRRLGLHRRIVALRPRARAYRPAFRTRLIKAILSGGTRAELARRLGLSETGLRRALAHHGIDVEHERAAARSTEVAIASAIRPILAEIGIEVTP